MPLPRVPCVTLVRNPGTPVRKTTDVAAQVHVCFCLRLRLEKSTLPEVGFVP